MARHTQHIHTKKSCILKVSANRTTFSLTNKCVRSCVCPYTDLRGVKHEIINKEAHLKRYVIICDVSEWLVAKLVLKLGLIFSTCMVCIITDDPALGKIDDHSIQGLR